MYQLDKSSVNLSSCDLISRYSVLTVDVSCECYLASLVTSSSDRGFPCFDNSLLRTTTRVISCGIGT